MVQLVRPDKNKHQYIIGIDFGHGETSAAICKKPDGGYHIADAAFHPNNLVENSQLSVCFKQAPQQIDGERETLMIAYMKTVYERILENKECLKEGNHIVYIARPSGWVEEETKELYRKMAIQAGIPLGGLTSESRAAIFYAMSPNVGFSKIVTQGAIVFDLGSSTLDFTYLSDNIEKPIDYGYDLGASIIERTIYEELLLPIDKVDSFLEKYPFYSNALLFKARQIKEEAYSKSDPTLKTSVPFSLGSIMNDEYEDYEDY